MKIFEVVTDPATVRSDLERNFSYYKYHDNPDMKALAPFIRKLLDNPKAKYGSEAEYIAAAQKMASAQTTPAPTATPTATPTADVEKPQGKGIVRTVKKTISRQKSAFAKGMQIGQTAGRAVRAKRRPKLRGF